MREKREKFSQIQSDREPRNKALRDKIGIENRIIEDSLIVNKNDINLMYYTLLNYILVLIISKNLCLFV